MNIDDYRAFVAQEKERAENPEKVDEPIAQTQQAPDGNVSEEQEEVEQVQDGATEEGKQEETNTTTEQTPPQVIEIDGQELTLDELKNGYLRQSDYTKKTQEARRLEAQAKEALDFIEQLQSKPQVAQQLSQEFQMPNLDPQQSQYTDLENKYFDLLIEKQVSDLTSKYGEFDVKEVLETARDNNLNDLDTAYHVVQSRKGGGSTKNELNVEELKEQIRQEILNEVNTQQASQVDTSTIIQQHGSGSQVKSDEPKVSVSEAKVAKAMGLNLKDYAKWRDAK